MNKSKKSAGGPDWSKGKTAFLLQLLFLFLALGFLFWRSFLPDYVHFSNDGPLGQQNTAWSSLPSGFAGLWDDLNDVGYNVGSFAPTVTTLIKWAFSPITFAKFYIPTALFILGLGAWTFFRALRLRPLAAVLGSLAITLSATFFAGACWGVASAEIGVGFNCFALALVTANNREPRWWVRAIRLALAGLCVGVNVIEAADVGALCSIFVAVYVFCQSIFEAEGSRIANFLRGVGRVAVVAIFATFIALQAVVGLVNNNVKGVAGLGQDAGSKERRWDEATEWSLPKKETLAMFIPGIFGYKMDTPLNMTPMFQKDYQNGAYWGGMGRTPAFDRWLDAGMPGDPPGASMRWGYAGYYCGILVVLLAIWAVLQSFRGANSVFTPVERRFVWFWTIVMVGSMLLAWGRFAPAFYGLLYQVPHFSDIRNPAKFTIFMCWAVVVLFAYGFHALNRQYLDTKGPKAAGFFSQISGWWAKAGLFERNWFFGSLIAFALSIAAIFVWEHKMPQFINYLSIVGYPGDDPTQDNSGASMAVFSLHQYKWFIGLFGAALLLIILVVTGLFSGTRARVGMILLTAFFLFDLGRADVPWVIHWDYKMKYEVGSLNPILDFLKDKPYEHRVAELPFGAPGYDAFHQLYRVEWMQHPFPYYDIQCLDIIQMPRMAADLQMYLGALDPRSQADVWRYARHWQLTNTRYLLGPAADPAQINSRLDPVHQSFHILKRFEMTLKPGIAEYNQDTAELTVVPKDDGSLALYEYGDTLPRAKLYGSWVVNTNDEAILGALANQNFDPDKAVLISTPEAGLPEMSTNENAGTVDFQSYAPKDIKLSANAPSPSVLLLNDKYDPAWVVTVDGKTAPLLHCNYLMRGVQVPAGTHTIEFKFDVHDNLNMLTLVMYCVGGLLGLALVACTFNRPSPAEPEVPPPERGLTPSCNF